MDTDELFFINGGNGSGNGSGSSTVEASMADTVGGYVTGVGQGVSAAGAVIFCIPGVGVFGSVTSLIGSGLQALGNDISESDDGNSGGGSGGGK